MKKILVLLGVATFVPTIAFAYMYEGETSAVDVLKRQGYSKSTAEAVDWANFRNGGVHSKYVRHYQPKRNLLGRQYQRLKEYVDPIQDNGTFGDNSIEFSNTWLGNDTFYSSDLKGAKEVERL